MTGMDNSTPTGDWVSGKGFEKVCTLYRGYFIDVSIVLSQCYIGNFLQDRLHSNIDKVGKASKTILILGQPWNNERQTFVPNILILSIKINPTC